MTVGEKIKALRMERNMSQEQLAEAVDVTRQSVSKWETGRANPDMDKLILLAQIYEVSLAELSNTVEEPVTVEEKVNKELLHMKRKRNGWRILAIASISVLLLCMVLGLFAIHTYYPSFWEKFGVKTGIEKNKKTVAFTHNNLYEDGIDGILEDLGTIIDYPEYLTLETTFDLRFAPDGTVTSMDTMWYGYDERYTYVDSYLISYDAGKSNKISVYFNGGTGDSYDVSKDMTTLFDAMRLISFEETVSNWAEPEYGVLYMGTRDWGYNSQGIVYLDRKGNLDIPSNEIVDDITGPTVSVYCTSDDTITPVRYLFCEDNMKERNVN